MAPHQLEMRLATRRLAAVTLLGLCYPDGAGSQSSSEVALADVDGSGDVGVNDLLLLLSAFGREGDVNACDVEGVFKEGRLL